MKKLKKLSSLLLATVMAISALFIPGTSFAGDYEASLAKAGFTSSYIVARFQSRTVNIRIGISCR